MKMKHSRWTSKVLLAAIVAQVVSILLMTNVISVADAVYINNIVAAVLQLLVILGVVNNPTDPNKL